MCVYVSMVCVNSMHVCVVFVYMVCRCVCVWCVIYVYGMQVCVCVFLSVFCNSFMCCSFLEAHIQMSGPPLANDDLESNVTT